MAIRQFLNILCKSHIDGKFLGNTLNDLIVLKERPNLKKNQIFLDSGESILKKLKSNQVDKINLKKKK